MKIWHYNTLVGNMTKKHMLDVMQAHFGPSRTRTNVTGITIKGWIIVYETF
jgi:hypothetical protein